MPKNLDQKIEEILTRGTEEIIPSKNGLKDLMKRKKIRLYLGVDPTSPKIHLGHLVPLKKLKQFQELGHETTLLFGTFTAQVGDPSGRDEQRKPLSLDQVKENMKTYQEQVSKFIDLSGIQIKYNADWLQELSFSDLIKITSNFTVSRLLERDMFQRRLKERQEVWVNEFLYPLMQGYDSVALDVDLEIGATDQTFNMLVGRKLQKVFNKKEKFILTTPILLGLDSRKMSKTFGNTVDMTDSPNEIYGKIMSLADNLIINYLELITDFPLEDIRKIKSDLIRKKINPRDVKAMLGREIVNIIHGKKLAASAEKDFDKVFRKKQLPSKIPETRIEKIDIDILELLVKTKLVSSRSEAKRLIMQKGVKIDGIIQKDWKKIIKIKKGEVIQIGKRKFVKLV
jgi:tyrosyl-tRNA synthetase